MSIKSKDFGLIVSLLKRGASTLLQGHAEISKTPYGILQGVKEGEAFTAGEWGSEICETMKPQGALKIQVLSILLEVGLLITYVLFDRWRLGGERKERLVRLLLNELGFSLEVRRDTQRLQYWPWQDDNIQNYASSSSPTGKQKSRMWCWLVS